MNFAITIADRLILVGLFIRSWGVDGYSDWATLAAMAGLLVVSEFGFQTFLGNMLTRAEVRTHARAFQRVVSLGMFFYISLTTGLMAFVLAIAAFLDLSGLLNLRLISDPLPVFLLLALYNILRVARGSILQIFRGKGEVYRLFRSTVRSSASALVLVAFAVWLGAGPIEVAAIYLCCDIFVGALWSAQEMRQRYGSIRLRPRRPTWRIVRKTASDLKWYGWLMLVNNLMNNVPILVIAWLGLAGPLLISFVVQRTLVNISKTVSNAISISLGLEVARAREAGGQTDYRLGVSALARLNAALAALTASGLIFFGPYVVQFWTSRNDLYSTPMVLWLVAPIALAAPAVPLQMLTVFSGLPRPQAIASIWQAAVGVSLAVMGGMQFGVVGVAAGVAIGEILGTAILLPIFSSRALDISFIRLVKDSAILFVLAAAWSSLVAILLLEAIPPLGADLLAIALSLWSIVAVVPVAVASIPRTLRARIWARVQSRARSFF